MTTAKPPPARDIQPEDSDSLPVFRFFNEVGIIHQLASTAFERRLPPGLTMAQFSVLNHFVRLRTERSPRYLARAFQVTKGAMTHTLQKLEAQGYITIRPDPHDGRGKRVMITRAGVEIRNQAIQSLTPRIEILCQRFPAEQFGAFLPFLQAIREELDAERNAVDFPVPPS